MAASLVVAVAIAASTSTESASGVTIMSSADSLNCIKPVKRATVSGWAKGWVKME